MKKWINDLTFNEVKEFLSHNYDIDRKLLDRVLDDAYFWVREYLDGAPRHDVSYKYFGRGGYFEVKRATTAFMNWIDDVQQEYEWLDTDTYEKCEQAYELWLHRDDVGGLSDEQQHIYETLLEEIGDEIYALMESEYWAAFEDDNKADTFMQVTEEFFDEDIDEIYVDTDTWDSYVADPNDEKIDSELNEQLELPIA